MMMFNNYNTSNENESTRITLQNVFDFLTTTGKYSIELKGDWDFWSENNRVLSGSDMLLPIRRLGRTEERYSKEIAIYNAILAAIDFVYPPKQYIPQSQSYYSAYFSQYDPLSEYRKYRNSLAWHTDNIPVYVAIRFGKEGIDWVLDKFGDEVKRCYYSRQN